MYRQIKPHFCDAGPRPSGGPRRAFTFTEVLVVVVILGIASAIVLPQVNSHDDLNTCAAARTVMADLLYAQNRAIAMQTMHYVTFDTTNQQYTLFSSMSPQQVLQHPINLNNYVMTFGKSGPNNISQSVALTSANFNGQTTIAFDETGVPYSYNAGATTTLSGTGTIVLTCGTTSLTISIAQDTGEITVN
jgi:prepilin-type N-terminal cleavage/methylation domain-containing protein